MYNVHARKRASGAPRTPFRACKISKFSGDVPPDPPHTIHFVAPHFLNLPWATPILSVALCVSIQYVKMPRLQNTYQIPGRDGEQEWANAKVAKSCYIPVSLEGTQLDAYETRINV